MRLNIAGTTHEATVTDQNSWQVEGEKIIAEKYPNWTNVYPDNYYSEQDAEKSYHSW